MPSGTTIQQFVNDLKDRKSTIARKFDGVYAHCKGNNADRDALVAELRAWTGTPHTLPNLQNYGADNLNNAEKAHMCAWPDKDRVINAMIRALEDNTRDIVFFWDLSGDPPDAAASESVIVPPDAGNDPPDPGGTGNITVTFLTPRSKVKQSIPTSLGLAVGGINLEV